MRLEGVMGGLWCRVKVAEAQLVSGAASSANVGIAVKFSYPGITNRDS